MTGLIYNKPENPLDFLESAIGRIRTNPELALKWDTFIDTENGPHSNGTLPSRFTLGLLHIYILLELQKSTLLS